MSTIEEELKNNGSYAAVAFGESMRPTLTPKTDVVIIEPCKAMPKKYDVILYRNDSGKYILHRVVRVKKECLVTRGDNTYVNEYVPSFLMKSSLPVAGSIPAERTAQIAVGLPPS